MTKIILQKEIIDNEDGSYTLYTTFQDVDIKTIFPEILAMDKDAIEATLDLIPLAKKRKPVTSSMDSFDMK